MKPSIGRVVHYVSFGTPPRPDGSQAFTSQCRAAIVTEVTDDPQQSVGLCVLNPTGQFFNQAIPHDEGGQLVAGADASGLAQLCGDLWYAGGSWHWPARVE